MTTTPQTAPTFSELVSAFITERKAHYAEHAAKNPLKSDAYIAEVEAADAGLAAVYRRLNNATKSYNKTANLDKLEAKLPELAKVYEEQLAALLEGVNDTAFASKIRATAPRLAAIAVAQVFLPERETSGQMEFLGLRRELKIAAGPKGATVDLKVIDLSQAMVEKAFALSGVQAQHGIV